MDVSVNLLRGDGPERVGVYVGGGAGFPGWRPPEPDLGCEAWLERANFQLMTLPWIAEMLADAAARQAHADRATALFDAQLAFLERRDDLVGGPAGAFLAAKSLFASLTSASLLFQDAEARERFFAPRRRLYNRLVDRLPTDDNDAEDAVKLSRRNNHVLMKALTRACWGRLADRSELAAQAAAARATYQAKILDSGCFEAEVVRGASAAWYTNLAVMMLTTMSWIERCSGAPGDNPDHDAEILARAVAFLDRSIEQPELYWPHSRRNLYPHPNHSSSPMEIDFGFLRGYHSSRFYLTWLFQYKHLFDKEKRAATPNIDRAIAQNADYFPKANEFSGGFIGLMVVGASDQIRPQSD